MHQSEILLSYQTYLEQKIETELESKNNVKLAAIDLKMIESHAKINFSTPNPKDVKHLKIRIRLTIIVKMHTSKDFFFHLFQS